MPQMLINTFYGSDICTGFERWKDIVHTLKEFIDSKQIITRALYKYKGMRRAIEIFNMWTNFILVAGCDYLEEGLPKLRQKDT